MNRPDPINYEAPHKMVVLSDPDQLFINRGIPCIDGGYAKIDGKNQKYAVRYDNKPELAAKVEIWKAAWSEYKAWQAAEFESNVPGLRDLSAAQDAAYNERARYDAAFERMMSTGNGIAPRSIDNSLEAKASELAKMYPRAAMYLRAKGYTLSNNVDKYGAGERAMELIAGGGSLEEAAAILENWMREESIWN